MKEVFANFMAAKIVNPAFPRVNHELRFLVAHYPAAYAVDRTEGTHPIRQELENLADAGNLYGAIIYQKAPIVMRQLERLIGADAMRAGLRDYLARFPFGNASWLDLVALLDAHAPLDVAAWSRAWVQEEGRPSIAIDLDIDEAGRVNHLAFVQADPRPERGLHWPQRIEVLLGGGGRTETIALDLAGARTEVPAVVSKPAPDFILPPGGGLAYGTFVLDDRSRTFLLRHAADLADPVARGAAWVALWDETLEGRIAPADFLNAATDALEAETAGQATEQIVQLLAGYLADAFWRFLPPESREEVAPRLEGVLRAGLRRASTSSLKATFLSAFRSVVTTAEGLAFLERVWRRRESVPGLTLAETDEAAMALDLAVRSVSSAAAVLEEQRERFTNPDRRERFEFVMPALFGDREVRAAFFRSLADPARRRREPWVVEGLRYLNHPLRASDALPYLRPALDLLEEIHRTGDIFFPRNWMDALLGGHQTPEAASVVRRFLAERGETYPPRLRLVILQAADPLFRAVRLAGR
jgi:aminopeptidase N